MSFSLVENKVNGNPFASSISNIQDKSKTELNGIVSKEQNSSLNNSDMIDQNICIDSFLAMPNDSEHKKNSSDVEKSKEIAKSVDTETEDCDKNTSVESDISISTEVSTLGKKTSIESDISISTDVNTFENKDEMVSMFYADRSNDMESLNTVLDDLNPISSDNPKLIDSKSDDTSKPSITECIMEVDESISLESTSKDEVEENEAEKVIHTQNNEEAEMFDESGLSQQLKIKSLHSLESSSELSTKEIFLPNETSDSSEKSDDEASENSDKEIELTEPLSPYSKFIIKECHVNLEHSKVDLGDLKDARDIILTKPNLNSLKRSLEDMVEESEADKKEALKEMKAMRREKSKILKEIVDQMEKIKNKFKIYD